MKLSLDVGPKAHDPVEKQSVVMEHDKFCRNAIQC